MAADPSSSGARQADRWRTLLERWRTRRRQLRRGVYGQPENRRILYARADELQDCMKEVEACADALAPPEPGWQSIETAPKDGTEVLLCEFRNGQYAEIEHGSWGFIEISDWDRQATYGWLSDSGRIDEPTHWMPRLAPPRADALEAPRTEKVQDEDASRVGRVPGVGHGDLPREDRNKL